MVSGNYRKQVQENKKKEYETLMKKSYMGKILMVDLGTGDIREETISDEVYENYLGGVGQAGENCSLIAGVSNDRGRIAARSGLGAGYEHQAGNSLSKGVNAPRLSIGPSGPKPDTLAWMIRGLIFFRLS